MNTSPEDFIHKILNGNHLPSGLVVQGPVNLGFLEKLCLTNFILPDNLTILGYLFLEKCIYLTHLPSGLVVNGWLYLHGCDNLVNLPPDLNVSHKIYCNKKLIDTIPKEDLPLYLNFKFDEYDEANEYFSLRLKEIYEPPM
jgi:hypothetical protein